MTENEIFLVDRVLSFFSRNKNLNEFLSILAEDRERCILLNEHHNVIELSYFSGKYTKKQNYEIMSITQFGASYEILDALFAKYKNNKAILNKLVQFCFRSKCKSYWDRTLKHTDLATEIMASILGGKE